MLTIVSPRLDPWAASVINEIATRREGNDGREDANASGGLRTSASL